MFHVEHFPNFLFLMALDIVQYKSGDPITAGLTYRIPGEINSDAWILQSTTQGAVFQMTGTAPTDEDWSNIQGDQFHINGTVTGLVLPILAYGYFRVVKEPVTEHATMALVEQEFIMEIADPINPFVAGTPVAPGYYDLSSLNLEAGKMYVLSVLPEQDKDYPQTLGIVTDETFSAVIVGLTGTKATQVILRGVTTVGSHLFVMTGAKPILHLGGRSNVKFNITVSPVVFSAGGGSFDPSQPATITGLWDLQNVSGINLVDEGPIILGKGDNAVKIHGSGTGSAVIEGANGATLDIAVPVDFFEPITYQDTVSYNRVGTTGEPIFQRWVMPRATLTLKGFEGVGTFGFANADGSQNYIGIDATGNVSFLKNTNHSGASTFSAGVTMGQTLMVTGKASFDGGIESDKAIALMDGFGVLSGSIEGYYRDPSNSGLSFKDSSSTTFLRLNYHNDAKRVEVLLPTQDSSLVLPVMESLSVSGTCQAEVFQFGPNSIRYNASTPTTVETSGDWKFGRATFTGATTFNAGVTMAQSLNCSSTLQVVSALYVGDSIQTNTDLGKFTSADLKFQHTAESTEDLQLVTDTGGVYIRIARENFYMASADPDPTDVLSVKEMDARYAKVVSLTKAAYTALATKDPTTIYLITDTTPRMWAIGDMEIVTADVPA